jgi:hypothetical protein
MPLCANFARNRSPIFTQNVLLINPTKFNVMKLSTYDSLFIRQPWVCLFLDLIKADGIELTRLLKRPQLGIARYTKMCCVCDIARRFFLA